jgi:hypothetical protein
MGFRLGTERTGVVELTLLAMPPRRTNTDAIDDDADDNPVLNFRKHYRLPQKPIVRCSVCGVEHRGKCFFLRINRAYKNKTTAEQVRAFVDAARQKRHEAATQRVVKRLIRELIDGIEQGRRAARRADRWTPETKKPGRPAGRRNLGLAKKNSES